jgi:hypothetical protein
MELTTPELAKHLGVSLRSIYSWISLGLEPAPRKRSGPVGLGRTRFWNDDDVARVREFRKTVPKAGARPGARLGWRYKKRP